MPKDFFLKIVSVEVEYAFEKAVGVLRKLGATLKEVSIPLLQETEDAGNQIAWAEATHYHQYAGWFPAHAADYGEDVRARLELGAKVAAIGSLGYKIGEKEWPNTLKMSMPGRFRLQKFLAEAKKAHCEYVVLEVMINM